MIKVERPGPGDDTRAWGPPYVPAMAGETPHAGYFAAVNRGKRSMTLDFTRPEGRDLVIALAREADVLIENYKVGTLARYGRGYEDLKKINPGLVYCSITGFGQSGPYAALPGYDFVFQGMSGLMSYTGKPDDTPGGGPVKVGVAIVDLTTGLYSTIAILGAIERRRETGEGTYIDMALLDCAVATSSYQGVNHLLTGRESQPDGQRASDDGALQRLRLQGRALHPGHRQ